MSPKSCSRFPILHLRGWIRGAFDLLFVGCFSSVSCSGFYLVLPKFPFYFVVQCHGSSIVGRILATEKCQLNYRRKKEEKLQERDMFTWRRRQILPVVNSFATGQCSPGGKARACFLVTDFLCRNASRIHCYIRC